MGTELVRAAQRKDYPRRSQTPPGSTPGGHAPEGFRLRQPPLPRFGHQAKPRNHHTPRRRLHARRRHTLLHHHRRVRGRTAPDVRQKRAPHPQGTRYGCVENGHTPDKPRRRTLQIQNNRTGHRSVPQTAAKMQPLRNNPRRRPRHRPARRNRHRRIRRLRRAHRQL